MTDIIAPPTISAFPPAPQPTDTPTEFDTKAFAKVNADVAFVPQANALAANVFNNATAAFERTAIAQAAAFAASGSASAAAGSASGASGSASAAAGSAGTAASAASTATAALTAMQVMYLGSKAVNSHPATDNMGSPLQAGALYTNTGTNAALNKRGWWWDGATWQLAWGDITGTYMPTTGGTFTGHVSGPAGAAGAQHPQAQEVSLRAAVVFDKTASMSNAPIGQQALYISTTGPGPDWPTGHPDVNAWSVQTDGVSTRSSQTARQVFSVSPGAGYVMIRFKHDATWSPWSRMITDTTAMSKQVTVNQSAGTPTYTVDPGLGGVHVVTINATCQFILPIGRQYGDEVTLHVISAGAIRAITFSANVGLPIDGTGALLPFPQYPANGMVSLIFTCNRVNRWECYYAGVH